MFSKKTIFANMFGTGTRPVSRITCTCHVQVQVQVAPVCVHVHRYFKLLVPVILVLRITFGIMYVCIIIPSYMYKKNTKVIIIIIIMHTLKSVYVTLKVRLSTG